ncbi:hypothetical protein Ahy_A07g032499 [Arachis hypogaea]|uniref:Uncharacterized protein n=1 Tax=Arachis hypogaea TaxID=3818 RepID=A0A445C6Y0_ARAHY|nr:hypothetical protein Ahy_A07g032499 [Arachis hypogaea]
MIYGSTGATHFDQLAKILTGYEITGARSSGGTISQDLRTIEFFIDLWVSDDLLQMEKRFLLITQQVTLHVRSGGT